MEVQIQFKNPIKQTLIKLRLWYPLSLLRDTPEALRWLKRGYSGAAPSSIKRMVVRSYLQRFSLKTFVETGTCLGDTLGYVSKSGVRCMSIELSRELYEAACDQFSQNKNVRLVHGDSAQRLPELLEEINEPALFWLDGHYSGGVTACGGTHTPISAELTAILKHPKKHIILIDDARCFNGKNDYPHLDNLLREIREDGRYSVEVSIDIIRLIPP